jgi:hypothetical protein
LPRYPTSLQRWNRSILMDLILHTASTNCSEWLSHLSGIKCRWLFQCACSSLDIPAKCDSHSEQFVDAVCNIRSISIDRFQRWREVGYLGNPANFSGTYISYLAHEALYFNYEYGALYEPNEEYDEITVFEREHYTGGWAATISQLVEFPSNTLSLSSSSSSTMEPPPHP